MATLAKTAPNFGALLNKKMSEVERPKPYPVGTYLCVVQGLPRFDKSTKKGTEFSEYQLKPLQALDDVDAGDLAEMGGLERVIKATYYHTEGAIWRLKEFLQACLGEDEDISLEEAIEKTPNCQVLVTIKHESSQDGETIYGVVDKVTRVES